MTQLLRKLPTSVLRDAWAKILNRISTSYTTELERANDYALAWSMALLQAKVIHVAALEALQKERVEAQQINARIYRTVGYSRDVNIYAWSSSWVLDANMLLCVSCSTAQYARDADQPFPHGNHCHRAEDLTSYPWYVLAQLLSDQPILSL